MKNTIYLLLLLFFASADVHAQNWDDIQQSGEYYYSVGYGETKDDAVNDALSLLSKSISVQIRSSSSNIVEELNRNGVLDSEQRMNYYVEATSQTALRDVKFWEYSKPPKCEVRAYILRSAVDSMYAQRVERAKQLVRQAEERLEKRQLDIALRSYYWAYALIRSVQEPEKVKDDSGNILIDRIPMLIEDAMDNIEVAFDKREGQSVDLYFTYKGEPVNSLNFTYKDGRSESYGSVKDGYGNLRVHSWHAGDFYHIDFEYDGLSMLNNDDDLGLIVNFVPKKIIPKSARAVKGDKEGKSYAENKKVIEKIIASNEIAPDASQLVTGAAQSEKVIGDVIKAISAGNYKSVDNENYFTPQGSEVYNKLIAYGTGKIIGTPKIHYFKGANGGVVARGLRMSFSFNGYRKTSFVEDVVFTVNDENRIDNISFGLGAEATNDLLCKRVSDSDAVTRQAREVIVEFMENYQTAYCLKRLDYIEQIFSDDAVIIRGQVLEAPKNNNADGIKFSDEGRKIIKYNEETKGEYLDYLRDCFSRKQFINLNFTDADVQTLDEVQGRRLYGVQLRQEYFSSNYSDKGYLFLMIDFTDKDEPLIMVRTWQPNEEDIAKIYHGGRFLKGKDYDEEDEDKNKM